MARKNIESSTEKTVMLALFTALVALLPYLGGFIKIGGLASISLTLIPVVLGAALCGPLSGAWLGGVSGIVTVEDLLEAIVGNMQDEYDNEEEEIEQVNETTYTLDGTTDIEEVAEILGIELPHGDYDTIGGFIMAELGRIPGEDESPIIEYEGYSFRVDTVDDRRIEKITAERLSDGGAKE